MTFAFIFSDVGFGEWFVLLAVILIVVGPKRLPETARKFGAWYSKFRRAADSFKRQLMDMDTEFERTIQEAERTVQETEQSVSDAFAVENDVSPELGSVGSESKAEASTQSPTEDYGTDQKS